MAGDEIGHNLTDTRFRIQDSGGVDEPARGNLGDKGQGGPKLKPSDRSAASRVWRGKHLTISERMRASGGMRALRNRLVRMGGESRQSVRSGILTSRHDQRIGDALAHLNRVAQGKDPKAPGGRYGIAQLGKSKHVKVRTSLQRTILQRDKGILLSVLKENIDKKYREKEHAYRRARSEIETDRALTPKEREAKRRKLDAEFVGANAKTARLAEQITDVVDLQIARIRNAKELDPSFDDQGMLDELLDAQEALESMLDALAPIPQETGVVYFPGADDLNGLVENLQKLWSLKEPELTKDLGSADALRDVAGGHSAEQQRQIRNDRAFIGKSDVVSLSQGITDVPISQASKLHRHSTRLCSRLESHGLTDEFECEAIDYKHKAVGRLTDEISLSGIATFSETPTPSSPNETDRIGHRMSLERHNDRLFYHRHRVRLHDRIEASANKAKRLAKTINEKAKRISLYEASLKEKRQRLHGLSKGDDLKIDVDFRIDVDPEVAGLLEELKIDEYLEERKTDIAHLDDDGLAKDLEADIVKSEKLVIQAKRDLAQLKDDLVETAGTIASNRERLAQLNETRQAKTVAKHFADDRTAPPNLAAVTADFNSALEAVRQDVEAGTRDNTSAEALAIKAALEKVNACADDRGQTSLRGRDIQFSVSVAEIGAIADKWKAQVDLEKDLRKLQGLERTVARAETEFRDRGLVSGWLHRLSFWVGFGGAYRRWANANDELKSARKAAFERFSAHVHFDDDKKLKRAFSNFVNYGFTGGGPWASDLSKTAKAVAGGLEAVITANDYLEKQVQDAGKAGGDAIKAILRNATPDSDQGGFLLEGTSQFLAKVLNGIEQVEHGAGAVASAVSVVNTQIKINEKNRKRRIGEELVSDYDNAKEKRKSDFDREHYAVRHGVSRMLGLRLSDQRTGLLRFEQLTASGQTSRHVISNAARVKGPHHITHATGANLLGQIGVGGAAVFEAGETVASLVKAVRGRLKSSDLEEQFQEKKRQFLSDNKEALDLQDKSEKELSDMSRDKIAEIVDRLEERSRSQIKLLKAKGGEKKKVHALRAEIGDLRKAFDDLSNLREFVTTLRERKKVNEKFVIFVKGLVATGGYSTAFIVSVASSTATLGPVFAAGALGVAGVGALGVKLYRSKKASNIARRALMADRALMGMAGPGVIKEIQRKAKENHVSAETIAWEMLTQKDPEHKAELLLADLHQEAGHLRLTDPQIKRKAFLENCSAQHLQKDIDLARQLEQATRAVKNAQRNAGNYRLRWVAPNPEERTEAVKSGMSRLNKACENAVKHRDKIKAQLIAHRNERLTVPDPDNASQKIDVESELERVGRDRRALFDKSNPDHSRTALILRDVVGMSEAEVLAMIDAGETRDDEHAAELSRALIVSHLEEE